MIVSSLFCGLEPHAITEMISTIEGALDEGVNQYGITVTPHLGVLFFYLRNITFRAERATSEIHFSTGGVSEPRGRSTTWLVFL